MLARERELRGRVDEEVGLEALRPRGRGSSRSRLTCPRCGSLWQVAHWKETPRYCRAATGAPALAGPRARDGSARWHFSHATPSCAPAKNSGCCGCRNVESLKEARPVARLAGGAELSPCGRRRGRTRTPSSRRGSRRSAGTSGTRGCAAASLWQAAQARRRVLAVEGELRLRRVVELRGLEARFRVAGRAVLAVEEALVRVLVAVGAARVLQLHVRRRLHVARLAGDARVPAAEREARLRVVELLARGERLEALRRRGRSSTRRARLVGFLWQSLQAANSRRGRRPSSCGSSRRRLQRGRRSAGTSSSRGRSLCGVSLKARPSGGRSGRSAPRVPLWASV